MKKLRKIKSFIKNNFIQIFSVLGIFIVFGFLFHSNVMDFQANILNSKTSEPFNGTVYPIQKTPNWVKLSTQEWSFDYTAIPLDKFINFPFYNPSELTIPFSSLNFNNANDALIRNKQVTFSTPYMGNYKLDGKEYAGSHLAVDIKVPMNTPVYAVANGVVVKANNEPSGYGNNVVLKHDNVPSLENESVKTTYFSGYAHLNTFIVNIGDLVSKGQLIGYSGKSGTATTPHLHFQIDNSHAPWHLYWPYTSKEARDAGLSFWGAVDAGLGQDKAIKSTINPLLWVQKYMSVDVNNDVNDDNENKVEITDDQGKNESLNVITPPQVDQSDNTVSNNNQEASNVITQPTINVKPEEKLFDHFVLNYEKSFITGNSINIELRAVDNKGQLITDFKPVNDIYVNIENGSAKLLKSYLNSQDFNGGIANVNITPLASFGLKVGFTYLDNKFTTDVLQAGTFKDLNTNDSSLVAINFLKDNGVIKGYPDGTFKPDNAISRVEALKMIYEGLQKDSGVKGVLEFSDTNSNEWYSKYVLAAQREGIVIGYPNNLFKPSNNVTKAEFLKMLLSSAGYNLNHVDRNVKPFDDVNLDDWYIDVVSIAKEKNLLDSSTNLFKPNSPITRREVAELIYRTVSILSTGKDKYQNIVANSESIYKFYR